MLIFLRLARDRGDRGVQNDCDIAEHRDTHDEAGQCGSQLQALPLNRRIKKLTMLVAAPVSEIPEAITAPKMIMTPMLPSVGAEIVLMELNVSTNGFAGYQTDEYGGDKQRHNRAHFEFQGQHGQNHDGRDQHDDK